MTLQNAFGDLATADKQDALAAIMGAPAQDDALQAILSIASAIAQKLPRLDQNGRLVASLAETTGGTLATVTGVTTVTTVTTVTGLSNIGAQAGFNSAAYAMPHLANAGAMHLYNQIQVS